MVKNIDPDFSEENEMLESEKIVRPRSILYEHPNPKHTYVVVFFVLLFLAFSLLFWSSKEFGDFLWASRDAVFIRHQYWRLFTALFTHSDLAHWLSNLPLFIIFGWFLRTYFGFLA